MSAKVYLIGAGPGDPGLLTATAREFLARADVIFHDRLIPRYLLDLCPGESTRLVDVGRLKDSPGPGQEKINQQLVEAARKHELTVRLKGGDPMLFGRGFEELQHLEENGVDCRVIPGISSLQAAGSHAGIPLTHRKTSSNFGVITGHTARPDYEHDWAALARLETLVVYMGITRSQEIAKKLIAADKSPATTVAVTSCLSRPDQRTCRMTLGELAESPPDSDSYRPGLIVVGPTAEAARGESWFEKLGLFGHTILITRPARQSRELARKILELGGEPVRVPLIETEPLPAGTAQLKTEINRINNYDWLVFTSQNGVRYFFETLAEIGHDVRTLAGLKLAAVGSATAGALEARNLNVELLPEQFTTRSLGHSVGEAAAAGAKILVPRAAGASADLQNSLAAGNLSLNEVEIYESRPVTAAQNKLEQLQPERLDAVTFTSPSTVSAFHELTSETEAENLLNNTACITIGPVTAASLEAQGRAPDKIAERHDAAGLLAALEDFFQ